MFRFVAVPGRTSLKGDELLKYSEIKLVKGPQFSMLVWTQKFCRTVLYLQEIMLEKKLKVFPPCFP